MKSTLVGRELECKEIQKCIASKRSEFVVVYGRRRIGKTFLVRSFFNDTYDFSFVGARNLTVQQQLDRFAANLQSYSKKRKKYSFTTWFEAFEALQKYLGSLPTDRKKIVFIDEMPWIDNYNSDFVKAVEIFWNAWANLRDDILLIACGSSTSWMVSNLIENQGGLHNRITNQIYLKPFNLYETELYLQDLGCNWDRFQIIQCYMVIGGVPFYLSLLDPALSLAQNIDRLFFKKNSLLQSEFKDLYGALFVHADKYISVVRALSNKKEGLTRQEISNKIGISGGGLTTILDNLAKCDFCLKTNIIGKKKKDTIYKLVDFYTLFYFHFIEDNKITDEEFWTHNIQSAKISSWQGLSFELICLTHTHQIKKALGIAGISTTISAWRKPADKDFKGAQIDLIIERVDRIINLLEMKFYDTNFSVTKDYHEKLRERMGIFRQATKTKCGIQNTLVTTFGLTQGLHSSIFSNTVTQDDLFGNI